MLGARKGSTPLSYNLQPNAQYLFDPVTRRSVRYVETVVPTLNLAEARRGALFPSDRYHANIGAANSSSDLPVWLQTVISSISYQNFDTSEKQFYTRIGSAGAGTIYDNSTPFIYPAGVFGAATPHAPKNASVAAAWIKLRARFNANADYATYGLGGLSLGGSLSGGAFNDSTAHFLQLARNAGSWEIGTCDGSTISQSSGGSADGSFHDFWIRWEAGVDVKLYVDQVLTITKTTNLPARPLCPVAGDAVNATNNIDIVDYLVEWELS